MPTELPPMLASFLRDHPMALVTISSDKGAVLIAKLPARDIESCRGRIPIHVQYELHAHPASPVVRLILTIYDQQDSPLVLETFFNPGDAIQMSDLDDLVTQSEMRLLCFDERLRHRTSKRVTQTPDDILRQLPKKARYLLAEIDPRLVNFDEAKLSIMSRNPL